MKKVKNQYLGMCMVNYTFREYMCSYVFPIYGELYI